MVSAIIELIARANMDLSFFPGKSCRGSTTSQLSWLGESTRYFSTLYIHMNASTSSFMIHQQPHGSLKVSVVQEEIL